MKQYRPKWRRHIILPKLTDREIEEACRLLSAYEVATIPPEDTYTDIRSADYTAYMEDLMAKSEAGVLRAPDVPMGWQYYTRKAVAAALIAALLAGIAMPERVMAGYRWLVEVVEQFFEDRKTEYLYTSNIDENTEFVPMQFGYLPEGMELDEKIEGDDKVKWIFISTDDNRYFQITQKVLNNTTKRIYGSNTNVYYTSCFEIDNYSVNITEEIDKTSYSFVYLSYHIKGQTNLSNEELIKIIKYLSLK